MLGISDLIFSFKGSHRGGGGNDVVSLSTVWRMDWRGESGKINSEATEKVHARYDYIQKEKGQDQ